LTLQYFWPLAAAVIGVALVWWARSRTLVGLPREQLTIIAVVRSIVIVLVALALAQPVLARRGQWTSVVFALDVSDSVAPEALVEAAAWVMQTMTAARPAHGELVAFAGRARAIGGPSAAAALASSPTNVLDGIERSSTNLEAAIDEALRRRAPGHVPRIVLISDGRPNAGSLRRALARAQQANVPLHTHPLSSGPNAAASIDAVTLPSLVNAGESFTVRLGVRAAAASAVTIQAAAKGAIVASKTLQVTRGVTPVSLDVHLDDRGVQMLEITVQDTGAAAGSSPLRERVPMTVLPRSRVLYVEGRAESAHYLKTALQAGGLTVDVAEPAGLPTTAPALKPYDLVFVSDVARAAIGDRAMDALATYVSDGGGLILAGGEAVFGENGYAKTKIEEILPVSFTVQEKPREFALIIILDKSWSMRGDKMELSKAAAQAAVDVLKDEHEVGVVVFNDGLEWTVPVERAVGRQKIKERIGAIAPSGHTIIYPAIEQAFLALQQSKARQKHVVLLSDGQSYMADYEGLVKKMVEAKITVSTIAVGDEADRELLGNIAKWGTGRAYMIDNPAEVPQVFVKETERAAKPTLVEEPFRPIVRKPIEALRGIDFESAPKLQGYSASKIKPTAELILVSDKDQPILARWQYGLGRAVVFTPDVKDRWAADWLSWPGYGKLWVQLVRETMRRPATADVGLDVQRMDEAFRVRLRTDEPSNASAAAVQTLEVIDGDGRSSPLSVTRVRSGFYEGWLKPPGRGDYVVRAKAGPDTPPELFTRLISYAPPSEERGRPPDFDLLRTISRDTGGAFDPRVEDLAAKPSELVVRRIDLWPYLAALALVLYLLDLLLRRLRFFDRASSTFGEPASASASDSRAA